MSALPQGAPASASAPAPAKPAAAGKLAAKVARPANPLNVATRPDLDEDGQPVLTPEATKGWMISVGLHAALLLMMGLWYFTSPDRGPKTLDSRLAGSEFGLDSGLTNTGGFDTPLGPEQGLFAAPLEPAISVLKSDLTVAEVKPNDLGLPADGRAGGGGSGKNPGMGNGDGFGIARFGNGGENIHGVAVKVGDPQFTLLWDTEADIDLHVLEPGGAEIYWEEKHGQRGGELDVDDTDGFGPENVYWLTDNPDGSGKEKGRGPTGEYRWFVRYYGGLGGIPKLTNWKVRVKHDGKTEIFTGRLARAGQDSKIFNLKVSPPGRALSDTVKGSANDR